MPTFIILFVLAAAANTAGLIGTHASQVQMLGRLVMVVALAAVGLQGHWRAFVGAGSRPLVLGLAPGSWWRSPVWRCRPGLTRFKSFPMRTC